MMRRLLLTIGLAAYVARADAAKIVEFTVPTAASQPYTIAPGRDGRLWFTEITGNKIGAMTTNGAFEEFTIPTADAKPFGITPGVESLMAFTKFGGAGKVGFIAYSGVFFPDSDETYADPHQIVLGPDLRLWLTDSGASKIYANDYRGAASAEGSGLTPGSVPYGITVWRGLYIAAVQDATNSIAVCNSITAACHEVPIPTPNSHPRRIVASAYNELWFTESGTNKIGHMGVSETITEFTIPTAASSPLGIALGSDGNIWFTESAANKIGRITQFGDITEYTIPTAASFPTSICTGSDGNIYFTENAGNKIGKLDVFVPGDVDDNGIVNVSDVFYLINFLFAGGTPPK